MYCISLRWFTIGHDSDSVTGSVHNSLLCHAREQPQGVQHYTVLDLGGNGRPIQTQSRMKKAHISPNCGGETYFAVYSVIAEFMKMDVVV